MKITAILKRVLTLTSLSLVLIATPTLAQPKEHNGKSRHVVVNGSKHHGNNHSSKRHYKSHKKSYHYNHKRRHHSRHNFVKGLVVGAAIHSAFGHHGSHYNGHAWCPSHSLYHTHSHGYSYSHHNYHSNVHYDNRYKVDSYIELDEGQCFKVVEFNNGDQRRKRIRDHRCADLEEWDEWEEVK